MNKGAGMLPISSIKKIMIRARTPHKSADPGPDFFISGKVPETMKKSQHFSESVLRYRCI